MQKNPVPFSDDESGDGSVNDMVQTAIESAKPNPNVKPSENPSKTDPDQAGE